MKKILVIWPTHREDWILPFKQLSTDFEFVFLSGITGKDKHVNYVKDFAPTIHWSSYGSAQQLLKEVQPVKLIFMSIESGLSIALNIAAKKLKLPTYILQHGIYTNYKDYRIRERLWKKKKLVQENKVLKAKNTFSSFRWINDSLKGLHKRDLLFISLLVKGAQKVGPYWAGKHFSFEGKKPTKYICFSPYNATIHKEVDNINESRIIYIGSPELSKYVQEENELIPEAFYLHIDQAFAENSFREETVSKERMISFYLKLNDFCIKKDAKLCIKLHPESFQSCWLPQHQNIVYLRKLDNLNQYIQSAIGCFGFYSTMVLPAVYWKPTILFKIFYSGLQESLKDIEQVKILPFEQFEMNELVFPRLELDQVKLIERFFYQKEPISLKLLTKILNG